MERSVALTENGPSSSGKLASSSSVRPCDSTTFHLLATSSCANVLRSSALDLGQSNRLDVSKGAIALRMDPIETSRVTQTERTEAIWRQTSELAASGGEDESDPDRPRSPWEGSLEGYGKDPLTPGSPWLRKRKLDDWGEEALDVG